MDLSAKLAALGNRVSSVEARQYSLNPNDILYSAIGEGTLFGCKVTQGVSATDMIVALEGQATGDESNWNPDYSATPERGYQYANIASGKDGAIRLQDTTATAEDPPATGTARIDIAYIFVGPNGAGFAIETGTPSVGTKTDFDTYGLDTAGYGLARLADPDLPVGALPVARIYVSDTVTGIPNARIADLRPQIGGAFGSMALQDSNNVSITGGSISVSTLEATTSLTLPAGTAAAPSMRFSGDTDTGIFRSAANVLGIAALGAAAMLFTNPASAVNFAQVQGNSTGFGPVLSAQGSDANVPLTLTSKGSSGTYLATNGGTIQFAAGHTASAANYVVAYGGAAGAAVSLLAAGSDANINFMYASKGAAHHLFYTGGGSHLQLSIENVTSAVNYWTLQGNTTGGGVVAFARGSDTNVPMFMLSKGLSSVCFGTNGSSTNLQLVVTHVASAVDYVQVSGCATGGNVNVAAAGSDTDVGMNIISKGTGAINLYTGGGARLAAKFYDVPSAVNYWQFAGAATTNSLTAYASGSDADVGILFVAKGAGRFRFCSASSSTIILQIANGTGTDYWDFNGGTGSTTVYASGGSTNIQMAFVTKGSGSLILATGGSSGNRQVNVAHVASAVNYWEFAGANTTNGISAWAQGSDTNINMLMVSKGTGGIIFCTGGSTATVQARVLHVASAVNTVQLSGNVTGSGVTVAASGTDTNIDLKLQPKGTGVLDILGTLVTESVTSDRTLAVRVNGTLVKFLIKA